MFESKIREKTDMGYCVNFLRNAGVLAIAFAMSANSANAQNTVITGARMLDAFCHLGGFAIADEALEYVGSFL